MNKETYSQKGWKRREFKNQIKHEKINFSSIHVYILKERICRLSEISPIKTVFHFTTDTKKAYVQLFKYI